MCAWCKYAILILGHGGRQQCRGHAKRRQSGERTVENAELIFARQRSCKRFVLIVVFLNAGVAKTAAWHLSSIEFPSNLEVKSSI